MRYLFKTQQHIYVTAKESVVCALYDDDSLAITKMLINGVTMDANAQEMKLKRGMVTISLHTIKQRNTSIYAIQGNKYTPTNTKEVKEVNVNTGSSSNIGRGDTGARIISQVQTKLPKENEDVHLTHGKRHLGNMLLKNSYQTLLSKDKIKECLSRLRNKIDSY